MKRHHNLFQILDALEQRTYRPGPYKSFHILEPKPRMISAAPYRDRVVHHALCNIISPLLEKTMIADSYANRVGKGTHLAIERFDAYARHYPFVLKCDIKKFFPSIDHEILRMFPGFRLLPSANVRKFRKRTRSKVKEYFAKKISLHAFTASLKGWEGHALRANTWRLRRRLIKDFFEK